MNKSIHFKSLRLDWKTPKAVYQILDAEFNFDHDPCPPHYKIDGLTREEYSKYLENNYDFTIPKFLKI
jgi:hypothetical protein